MYALGNRLCFLLCASLALGGCQTVDGKGGVAAGPEGGTAVPVVEGKGVDLDLSSRERPQDWKAEVERDVHGLRSNAPNRDVRERIESGSERLEKESGELRRGLEKPGAAPTMPQPVMPQYNRLDDIMVTLSMDKEDVRHIFRALAEQTKMNLLINPQVVDDAPSVSVNFVNVPASTVLREILELADLHGRIEENTLRVDPFREEIINLDYLDVSQGATFDAGGDVLGSAGGGKAKAKGISGNFSVKGTGPKSTNAYEVIEASLKELVKVGQYQVNRLTGTLYLNAKPSEIRAVTSLLQRYKEVLNRQLLIEARVMEVALTDRFATGINWSTLHDRLATISGSAANLVRQAQLTVPDGTGLGQGLGLSFRGSGSMAAVEMLKHFGDVQTLSNPSIRARHGMPALITVGRSESYISEIEVTPAVTQGGAPTADITTDSVFGGLMLGIVPFITSDNRIQLTVHPLQSEVTLGAGIAAGTTTITTPKVDLKEISTILEVGNDETVMIGGLISESKTGYRTGIPVLSELPVLGRLFSQDSEDKKVRELVIMLRATIL
ncbi:MAG: pilus (MSHA type) biogenesis protein MshL [Magnetococcales bacterium]|nr:pilus (MSHA type) biogenesis protein MshL [Magnetococcales bacterium]